MRSRHSPAGSLRSPAPCSRTLGPRRLLRCGLARNSTGTRWTARAATRWVVVSCGGGLRYGDPVAPHPVPEVEMSEVSTLVSAEHFKYIAEHTAREDAFLSDLKRSAVAEGIPS